MAKPTKTDEHPPRWIDYVDLDELVPADVNPKEHDTAGMAASTTRFGLVEPPVVDERTGKLVAGHGRRDDALAKRAAGQDPPDGVVVDDSGKWLLPVLRGWASIDDDHAKGYLVASNKVGEGLWDPTSLAGLLQGIEEPQLLDDLGFKDYELEVLLAAIVPEFQPDPVTGSLDNFTRTDGNQHAIKLGDDEHATVMMAISECRHRLRNDDLTNNAALALICREYLDQPTTS